MARWEQLEEYLFDHEKAGSDFTVYEYAEEIEEDIPEASLHIQSYLVAQRAKKSKTLYVLHRKAGTRTTNARWQVGIRTKDARLIGRAFYDDTAAKVRRAFIPDLHRIRVLNPRAARQVERQIDGVIDGAMKILALAAEGVGPEEDD